MRVVVTRNVNKGGPPVQSAAVTARSRTATVMMVAMAAVAVCVVFSPVVDGFSVRTATTTTPAAAQDHSWAAVTSARNRMGAAAATGIPAHHDMLRLFLSSTEGGENTAAAAPASPASVGGSAATGAAVGAAAAGTDSRQAEYGTTLEVPTTYATCGQCGTAYALTEADLNGSGRYVQTHTLSYAGPKTIMMGGGGGCGIKRGSRSPALGD